MRSEADPSSVYGIHCSSSISSMIVGFMISTSPGLICDVRPIHSDHALSRFNCQKDAKHRRRILLLKIEASPEGRGTHFTLSLGNGSTGGGNLEGSVKVQTHVYSHPHRLPCVMPTACVIPATRLPQGHEAQRLDCRQRRSLLVAK